MRLDLHVLKEAEKIKLNIRISVEKGESDYRLIEVSPFTLSYEQYKDQSIPELMINKFNYPNTQILHSALNRKVVREENAVTSLYELPTDKEMLLDFLAAMDDFIIAGMYDQVNLNDKKIMDLGPSLHRVSPSEALGHELLALPETAAYKEGFLALNKLLRWHSTNKEKERFTEMLEIKTRFNVLNDINLSFFMLKNNESTAQEKKQHIHRLAKKILQTRPANEIAHLLGSLDREKKMTLFASSLTEDVEFNWKSPEWQFFRDAQFNFKDGKAFIDINENGLYQSLTESTRRSLITQFAAIFELEFDKTNNFNKKIIFSENSSEKIKMAGLNINGNYFAKLLQTTHSPSHSLFTPETSPDTLSLEFVKEMFSLNDDDIEKFGLATPKLTFNYATP